MTKPLLLTLIATSVLFSSGCLFHRKGRKPKETSAIATETETEFRQRWIARRVTELNAHGVTGAAAEQQAANEFSEKFAFATPGKK